MFTLLIPIKKSENKTLSSLSSTHASKKKAGTKPKLDDDPENYRSHLRASLLKKNGLTVSREKQIE